MFCQVLLYFLLFGLTFLIVPTTISPYEVPKAYGAIFLISLLFLLALPKLFSNIPHRRWDILRLSLSILLIIMAIYHLLYPTSFLPFFPLPVSFSNLLWGNAFRPQGTLFYISLFLLFLISSNLPTPNKNWPKIAFFSLIGLLIYTLVIGPKTSLRFIGPLGEANSLAAVVLFLFPLASFSSNPKHKNISLALSALLILLSGSRAGILGFLAEFIILFLRRYRNLFFTSLFGLVLLLTLAFITPFIPHPVPGEIVNRFENRAEIWTVSFQAGFDHPAVGTGFGSAAGAIRFKSEELKMFTRFQPIDSAHNIFLQWWMMGGSLGLILFIILIGASVVNLYRQKSWSLLSILLGLLIIQLFNPVSSLTLVHFWWVLGVSFGKSLTWRG